MRRITFAILASALAFTSTALADEQPADPPVVVVEPAQPPPNAVVTDTETRMNTELIGSGLVVFGLSYGSALVVAGTSERDSDERLFIPVLGPWMDLADRGECDIDNSACDGETRNKVLLVIDGVFQAGGLAATIIGVFSPHRTQVTRTAQTGVKVLPVSMGRGAPGIGVFGRF